MSVCIYVLLPMVVSGCWIPPGARIIGGCEMHDVGAGTQTQVLFFKSSMHSLLTAELSLQAHVPSLIDCLLSLFFSPPTPTLLSDLGPVRAKQSLSVTKLCLQPFSNFLRL